MVKKEQENVVIKVKRGSFSLSKEFENQYGEFILKTNNVLAGQINEFTLNDLHFFPLSEDAQRISDHEEAITKAGYIPLDVYAAHALYKKIKSNREFRALFLAEGISENLAFLGSVLVRDEDTPGKGIEHYVYFTFDFRDPLKIPKFICFENDFCVAVDEYAVVYRKRK